MVQRTSSIPMVTARATGLNGRPVPILLTHCPVRFLSSHNSRWKYPSQVQGLSATFTAGVTSSVPFTCQWQWNGTDIPGANAQVYTVPHVEPGNVGSYRLVATNSFGPGSHLKRIAWVGRCRSLGTESVRRGSRPDRSNERDGHCCLLLLRASCFDPMAPWTGWGQDAYLQATIPPGLSIPNNTIAIAAGDEDSLVLSSDGILTGWGRGDASGVPAGLHNVVSMSAGFVHGIALTSDGTVTTWGYNPPAVPPGSLGRG